ncbi:MAG: sulfatase-like hydrolase/transferase [Reichenbachiella sp.]|uniref:sulfatase-like hydrolase/transferase n=1 Tax=Reichenbachiella sp. TaxID=2184521 RepID=UPI003297AB37
MTLPFSLLGQKPNLVIIQTDEHNFRTIGAYRAQLSSEMAEMWGEGIKVETPHLDALASQGVLCTNYNATSPVCTPSRASFMSGLYPHATGAVSNDAPYDDNIRTFAHQLKDDGYSTSYLGKWHLDGSAKPGIDPARNFGFDDNRYMWNKGHYKVVLEESNGDITLSEDMSLANSETFTTDFLADKAIEIIERDKDGPFCVMISIPDPHSPDVMRAPYDQIYNEAFEEPFTFDAPLKELRPTWGSKNNSSEASSFGNSMMRNYFGAVKCIDDNVGKILAALEDKGLTNNTIVVFTSDHGDQLFEHNRVQKGLPYEASSVVPFIIRYPDVVSAGKVIDKVYTTADFAPTILGLMNVAALSSIHGLNTSADFTSSNPVSDNGRIAYMRLPINPVVWASDNRYKLVVSDTDDPWLFDKEVDPYEVANFFENPAYSTIAQNLSTELGNQLDQFVDPFRNNSSMRWTSTVGSRATGISVSPATASVGVGATTTLSETVTPSNATIKNVIYYSSNTSVAKVDIAGIVTGISPGTATITAVSIDGGFTATSVITVGSGGSSTAYTEDFENMTLSGWGTETFAGSSGFNWSVDAKGVTGFIDSSKGIYNKNKTMVTSASIPGGISSFTVKCKNKWNVGQPHTIDLLVNGTVVGSSNTTTDNTVYDFTVNNINLSGNVVIALAVGTNTIAIDDMTWTTYDGGSSSVSVTGINLSPSSASVAVGATTSLTESISPSNATDKSVTWSSNNTSVATVSSSGLVSGVAAGSATITVSSTDGGFTAASDITVTSSGGTTTKYEAEDGTLSNVTTKTNGSYSGAGYCDYDAGKGNTYFIEWTVNAASSGAGSIAIEYANGHDSADRGVDIVVNGTNEGRISMTPTGGGRNWETAQHATNLNSGSNTIRLVAQDNYGPNIDFIEVTEGGSSGGGSTTYTEDFEDMTLSDWGTETFTGNNNFSWSVEGKGVTGFVDTSKGIYNKNKTMVTSGPIPGGISDFSVQCVNKWNSGSHCLIELLINGEVKGASNTTASNAVYTFAVDNINVSGDVTIALKVGDQTIAIDNITWTGYSSGVRFIESKSKNELIDKEMLVYPNPITVGQPLSIDYTSSIGNERLDVSMINILGRTVFARQYRLIKGLNSNSINTNGLSSGTYLLRIKSPKGLIVKKICLEN